jgi:hypothetical protein
MAGHASSKHVQTELPKEVELEGPNICAWCGEPSDGGYIEIQPARYKQTRQVDPVTGKHIRVMRKQAVVAKVCQFHRQNLKMVEKSPAPSFDKPASGV